MKKQKLESKVLQDNSKQLKSLKFKEMFSHYENGIEKITTENFTSYDKEF